MRPLAYTFPYAVVFWIVFFWAFLREAGIVNRAQKGAAKGGAPDDQGSLRFLLLAQSLGFGIAFYVAWLPWGRFADPRLAFWLGLALLVSGAILRRLCFRALGASFTGEVRVRPDQHVVRTGPYRWVRHPSYTAGILMIVGAATALGSWVGVVMAFVLSAVGYAYRVRVEERALVAALGDAYREYAATTKRFIPLLI
ncbi:MAG TPA: isoprenylcysteine carboxylmethyltransferase family protein [Gemmatimonadaceae bacterium]|nr:isoprenylcysteine carboxylmethyltransferase family protein [Gemmatimonadaceae bacterium]